MTMSFGYSRPHSSDSWRSRRPSFELSSTRMHSVPRNTSRTTLGNYPDYNFVESPLYYMHRNDTSGINNDKMVSLSPRSHSRGYDREENYKYQQPNVELQRKMSFNLHEEIQKPFLTIILEEISDPERITDICYNTLSSMMRSKSHRKYLHHMNNSAIPSSQRCDQSHNNETPLPGKGSNPDMHRESRSNMGRDFATAQDKMNMHFEKYKHQSVLIRKKRQEEITALEKLKGRLPPQKKRNHKVKMAISVENDKEDVPRSRAISTMKVASNKNVVSTQAMNPEENENPIPKPKPKPKATAEEILRTRWLRLTDDQVADLEAEIRAAGKDPGIHDFTPKHVVDRYAHTLVTVKDPERINSSKKVTT